MKALFTILTIAKYESRVLFRSWFFRIFSLGGLFFIVVFNLVMLLDDGPRWNFRALPAALPLTNMIILNIAQSIIIAFLATDFLKRDKKLDTTEVIYIRSMSNGEYILGKSLGTLLVFFLLNLLVLLFGGIINAAMEGIHVDFVAYVLYPSLISIPTLVYILGLAFVLMLILRNQAVTFVVLLGYIGATLFYFRENTSGAFNFLVLNFPMLKSDMAGLAHQSLVVSQRLSYLLLGIGFIFSTILLLSRLRQSVRMTVFSWIMTVSCLLAGSSTLYFLIRDHYSSIDYREEARKQEEEFVMRANPAVISTSLKVRHDGDEIEVTSSQVLKNGPEKAETFFFVLNPGLEVSRVSEDNKELTFHREGRYVVIESPFLAFAERRIEMEYRGNIEENAMYLDIDEETRAINYRINSFSLGKRYHYLQKDYVLLTHEAGWYPETRIPFNKARGVMNPMQFVQFDLEVYAEAGKLPISQGKREQLEEGHWRFKPEEALPQISLIIGDYEEMSVTIDSIEYRMAYHKGHDYFRPYFTNLGDSLESVITDIKNDFERELDLSYPFPRYTVVEVPAHYVAFPRLYTVAREVMQPEMSLLPEKGLGLRNADFQFRKERMEEDNKRNGSESTALEVEKSLFTSFVTNALTIATGDRGWSDDPERIFTETYSVFPNYFSFVNFIESPTWPFFNKSYESYLWNKVAPQRPRRFFEATSDGEKANLLIQKKSFDEILREDETELVDQVIQAKGNFIFKMVQQKTGEETFSAAMKKMTESGRFQSVGMDRLDTLFGDKTAVPFSKLIEESLSEKGIPGFLFSDMETLKFIEGDRTRYAVTFAVTNSGNAEGLIEAGFRMGGRGEGGRGGRGGGFMSFSQNDEGEETGKRILYLKPGETKQATIVFNEEPRSANINTFVSANLPQRIVFQFEDFKESKKALTDEILVLDRAVSSGVEGEYIVDNEDEGFSFSEGRKEAPLRAFVRGEEEMDNEEYIALTWRVPMRWSSTLSTWAYGREVKSVRFIHTGDGSQKAAWTVEVAEAGQYDILVWYHSRINGFRWGNDNETEEEHHYIVHHTQGSDEIVLELRNAINGWNRLGSFSLKEGENKVELTNESPGRTVIADAVKWIKR